MIIAGDYTAITFAVFDIYFYVILIYQTNCISTCIKKQTILKKLW